MLKPVQDPLISISLWVCCPMIINSIHNAVNTFHFVLTWKLVTYNFKEMLFVIDYSFSFEGVDALAVKFLSGRDSI